MHNSPPFAVRGPYNSIASSTSPTPVVGNSPPVTPPIEMWEERIQDALRRTSDSLGKLEQRITPVSRSAEAPPYEAPLDESECDLHRVFARMLHRVEENNYLLSRIHQNLCL